MEMGFADFFFILLSLSLLYIAWLWLRELGRVKNNSWQLSRSQLFHCNNCHWAFVPKEPVSLCRCPRCNTVCIRRRNNLSPAPEAREKK